jgi:AcrR family transcriptional regulator
VPAIRRRQEDRTAETRGRLLDATIQCLIDVGYARTTTSEIAQRAGLSRGAQLHHFPTKAQLVTTAVEHLFRRRDADFRAAIATLPQNTDRAQAAVDLLWSFISGPTFYAWLELVVAARTDPELGAAVRAMDERFVSRIQASCRELFGGGEQADSFLSVASTFTFAVLQGLALDAITRPDDPRLGAVIEAIKALARVAFPCAKGSP